MRTIVLVPMALALIWGSGCASINSDAGTELRPRQDGSGVRISATAAFDSPAELPGAILKALGDMLVSVTQPIHPYHYIRDADGQIERDAQEGRRRKVWLPFWRVVGKHHGDSVVGIIYDHGWFGCWDDRPGDKLGKLSGLLLLAWGTDQLLAEDQKDVGTEPIDTPGPSLRDQKEPVQMVVEEVPSVPPAAPPSTPPSTPTTPPVIEPSGWDLDGMSGPVGM